MLLQETIIPNAGQQIKTARDTQRNAQTATPGNRVQRLDVSGIKQVYDRAIILEWFLISNYSSEDFGDRFVWPEVGPEMVWHY